MRVGLTAASDDFHSGLVRDVHHRSILGQAMHEQGADEMVASETRSPLEQRRADAAASITDKNAHAEFRNAVGDSNVRHRSERKVIGEEAEHRVAVEIDAVDIIEY